MDSIRKIMKYTKRKRNRLHGRIEKYKRRKEWRWNTSKQGRKTQGGYKEGWTVCRDLYLLPLTYRNMPHGTWVWWRRHCLLNPCFGLQPLKFLCFIALPSFFFLLCSSVLQDRAHKVKYSLKYSTQNPEWKLATTPLNWPPRVSTNLNGRHLRDLVNILQRTGDIPQRCLVGQLFCTCKKEQNECLSSYVCRVSSCFWQWRCSDMLFCLTMEQITPLTKSNSKFSFQSVFCYS